MSAENLAPASHMPEEPFDPIEPAVAAAKRLAGEPVEAGEPTTGEMAAGEAAFQYVHESTDTSTERPWQAPGFDMPATVASVPGHVLELGGPTPTGFRSLQGVSFREPPIVTNVGGSALVRPAPGDERIITLGADSVMPHDSERLGVLVDMRHLPFPDASLSVVLASAPAQVPIEATAALENDWDRDKQERKAEERRQWDAAVQAYQTFLPKIGAMDAAALAQQPEANGNPVIGMILEAKRVLANRGLLVLKNTNPGAEQVATRLGFEVKMRFSSHADQGELIGQPEIVLQKV